MESLTNLEQRPRGALYVHIALGQTAGERGKRTGNVGVVLLHEGNSAVNGSGSGKILIGNLPQQLYPGCIRGVTIGETGGFAETIQNKLQPFPPTGFPKILLNPGGAPQ